MWLIDDVEAVIEDLFEPKILRKYKVITIILKLIMNKLQNYR